MKAVINFNFDLSETQSSVNDQLANFQYLHGKLQESGINLEVVTETNTKVVGIQKGANEEEYCQITGKKYMRCDLKRGTPEREEYAAKLVADLKAGGSVSPDESTESEPEIDPSSLV